MDTDRDKLREDQGHEDRAWAASSHPRHATERGLRREVSIILEAACQATATQMPTRHDRKRCTNDSKVTFVKQYGGVIT